MFGSSYQTDKCFMLFIYLLAIGCRLSVWIHFSYSHFEYKIFRESSSDLVEFVYHHVMWSRTFPFNIYQNLNAIFIFNLPLVLFFLTSPLSVPSLLFLYLENDCDFSSFNFSSMKWWPIQSHSVYLLKNE